MIYKVHISTYTVFEFLLDINNIPYTIVNEREEGYKISDMDFVAEGQYIEYEIESEYIYFVDGILPFQPYESLEVYNEHSQSYKKIKLIKIRHLSCTNILEYVSRNIKGKEEVYTFDFSFYNRRTQRTILRVTP